MKSILFVFCFLNFQFVIVYSQKVSLNHSSYHNWETISQKHISSDARYVFFGRQNGEGVNTLVLSSYDGKWKMEIVNGSSPAFVGNNQFCVYRKGKDSLHIARLGSGLNEVITGVSSFKSAPDGSRIAYLRREKGREGKFVGKIVVRSFNEPFESFFEGVDSYQWGNSGRVLVLKGDADSNRLCRVYIVDFVTSRTDTINVNETNVDNFVFDSNDEQLVFMGNNGSTSILCSVFYYRRTALNGFVGGEIVPHKNASGVAFTNSLPPKFILNDRKILVGLASKEPVFDSSRFSGSDGSPLIWQTKADKLLSRVQFENAAGWFNQSALAVLDEEGQISQLADVQGANKSVYTVPSSPDSSFLTSILEVSNEGFEREQDWLGMGHRTAWLLTLKPLSRRLILKGLRSISSFCFSPTGKYLIWYDPMRKGYFSFSVATGVTRAITNQISTVFYDDEFDKPDYPPPFGILGWGKSDEDVFIYDRFDIWKVDPAGQKRAINITNGYGKINNIVLRHYKHFINRGYINGSEIVLKSDSLLLRAYNRDSQYEGFFKSQVANSVNPRRLVMGPFRFSFVEKARNSEHYILGRMSLQESENIYVTKDFRKFEQLSNINPWQKDFIWLKCEVVRWRMTDGRMSRGLLYKPENFDSLKKYPVIFHFYERNEYSLFQYLKPESSNGTLNIPYFVSNGYLVFVPDIYYKIGHPGESAVNSVVSAALALSRYPWVDRDRMGLQGISFGGYEVNYIVTKTNLFAAAASSAGPVNLVSAYGSIVRNGASNQFQTETSQSRIGSSLWESPELYIKNSPIFSVDKISTPLLIQHNDKDDAVPFAQAVEFFLALRRLGKSAWLIEYPGEGHGIYGKENKMDFSKRLAEFFDYFLKGNGQPKWLIQSK